MELIVKKAVKKFKKTINSLTNQPRPVGMVGMNWENAQNVYGSRPDVEVHRYFRPDDDMHEAPGHLADEGGFSAKFYTFPQDASDYEAILLDARNPGFTFQHNHLIDDLGRVVYEPDVQYAELPIQHEFLKKCTHVKGSVAYLSNTVVNHYGHWLQLQLPLLLSYWDTFGKDNIDYYYIGDCPIPGFIVATFERLGLRREQILNYPCQPDRSLIAIKYRVIDKVNTMRDGIEMDKYSFEFLKTNLFQPDPAAFEDKYKRIFVLRGNVTGRREQNLDEIKAVLEPYGFTYLSMEGRTMQEQANIFGNADLIVGVHGSAFHNVLYSKPGTKVIEIFPYDYPEAANYYIARLNQCDYYYTIGEPMNSSDVNSSFLVRNSADIVVNTNKLLRLLKQALQEG